MSIFFFHLTSDHQKLLRKVLDTSRLPLLYAPPDSPTHGADHGPWRCMVSWRLLNVSEVRLRYCGFKILFGTCGSLPNQDSIMSPRCKTWNKNFSRSRAKIISGRTHQHQDCKYDESLHWEHLARRHREAEQTIFGHKILLGLQPVVCWNLRITRWWWFEVQLGLFHIVQLPHSHQFHFHSVHYLWHEHIILLYKHYMNIFPTPRALNKNFITLHYQIPMNL